eukprot:CAMPEP_0202354322 /NCGR_PEP_ID=MMETSP1126-20121109/9694_1 /ASSEMBLY_ACC=CAM_ASM_000457 /TAXON_ID=3047 /ORGANISM="Dunaliella tertiolecta, Strain CCMP1320" /LENGTH=314 /DNA_ID=CAMNT_0048946777 /DNA_START=137 /DNA_END=1078 /DNA_ORIENTATION=-
MSLKRTLTNFSLSSRYQGPHQEASSKPASAAGHHPNSASLRKAFITLLGGRGKLPRPEELDIYAESVFKAVIIWARRQADGTCLMPEDVSEWDDTISRRDLYHYLVHHSEYGLSQKTCNLMFTRADADGNEKLTLEEMIRFTKKCYQMLVDDGDFDERMIQAVPAFHVVPGSCKLNALSGTRAFEMRVVRRQSMRRIFSTFEEVDGDRDGKITLPEFKWYIKKNQPHAAGMATSMFHSLDKDYVANAQPDGELMKEIQNIFAVYDDDKSGSLDFEEFSHALNLCGFDPKETAVMFKEIDRDGSGEVSYEEFELW